MRPFIILVILFFITACKKNNQTLSTETPIRNFDKKSDINWNLVRTIKIDNYDVTGLSSFKHLLLFTDSINNVFVEMDTLGENSVTRPIESPLYLRSTGRRLLIPSAGENKILVYRGGDPYELDIFDQTNCPTSAFAHTIDHYVVADGKNHRLLLSTLNGEQKFVGSKGSQEGLFNYPTNVVMHKDEIFVLDSGNQRVQVFDMNGIFKRSFGADLGMVHPTGLTLNGDQVFVSDIISNSIHLFSKEGQLLETIEEYINGPTAINFENNNLYVANKNSKNIVVLRKD